MGDIYTNPPQSRNEAILRATIDGTEYTAPPQSRIEDLLLELKEAIEQGGGSVESYEQLTNKPQINGTTLSGDKSTEDLIPIDNGLEFDSDGKLAVSLGNGLAFNSDGEIDNLTEANPSDSATGELSKLKVGSDIYSVVTKAVNDLTNYYKKSEVYTKAEVNNIAQARFAVVAQLPTEDIQTNVIYLVPKSTAQTNNDYDEYIYALKSTNPDTYGWEKIGDTEIDLSDYVTTQALNTALADYTTTTDLTTLLAGKEPTISVTANRALVSDANGKVSASSVTDTEVGYLSGVTGAIQTQLDGKQNTLTFDATPIAQSTNPVTSGGIKTYVDTQIENAHIYGVEWDGSSTSKWTRTDASRYFAEPQPAINNGNGYSPFDNVFPWAGMVVIDDPMAGSLVSIPKFWYKWTRNGSAMKLQIADAPVDGFHVSPAHADRGDGAGERDVVYIGRYHCADDYTSKTGVIPLSNKTRAEFRTGIHTLGSNIWQNDFAMFWTIRMLYLVEFADWNSQVKFGLGCGNNNAKGNMGYTDAMTFHTGTSKTNRTAFGLGTQYRHIEGLYDNVLDFIDGIYFDGIDIYGIKKPSDFSDSTGGTNIGTRLESLNPNVVTKTWTNPTVNGFEYALFPESVITSSNFNYYSCDQYAYASDAAVLCCGGAFYHGNVFGLFAILEEIKVQDSGAAVGSRLMVLP